MYQNSLHRRFLANTILHQQLIGKISTGFTSVLKGQNCMIGACSHRFGDVNVFTMLPKVVIWFLALTDVELSSDLTILALLPLPSIASLTIVEQAIFLTNKLQELCTSS